MNLRQRQQASTRTAILEALGLEIAESGVGFSIQDVADRAGVTHRTVYNHFPTREALNDAFAEHLEDELARSVVKPDADLSLGKIMTMAGATFAVFDQREADVRASVMLMIASRRTAKVTRARTAAFERVIEREAGALPPGTARMLSVAVRMFMSSTGWHVMTEHLGLSSADASTLTQWVGKVIFAAVKRGDFPRKEEASDE